MKKLLPLLGLVLALVASLPAQDAPPPPATGRTPEQLDQLLGPIALYPDALIALILPAASASPDIVLASRYLEAGNDPSAVDSQPWDDSVRSLAHYPEIVKWMDQNLAWTKQVGDAFLAQPTDVMQAVQRLRAAARAVGSLTDTPQQQVVMDGDLISIVPAQPDTIYVPYYDPDVVYVSRSGFYTDSYLTFGVGFPVGSWLTFDLDWGHRRIWYVGREERERYWREHRDWRHPVFPGRPGYVHDGDRHPWTPPPQYAHPPQADARRWHADIVRPTPPPNSPPRPPVGHQDPPTRRPDNRDHPVQFDDRGHEHHGAPDHAVAPVTAPPAQPQTPPTGRPDNRDRPVQSDGREHEHRGGPDRPGAPATAPAIAPTAPIAQPQTPPPVQPPVISRGRGEGNPPDQRGREFQGRPVDRAPIVPNPPAPPEHAAPVSRQVPPGPPPSHVRPAPPAPPPPPATNQPPPAPAPDDKKKNDRDPDRKP